MPHLSELHGATTHLAVVAIVLYPLLLVCRRRDLATTTIAACEPWVLGAAVVGAATAGLTGLLVHGESQTTLRGTSDRIGAVHFWLGIGLAVVLLVLVLTKVRHRSTHTSQPWSAAAVAVLGLAAVTVQGYIGGRMTYEHAVGVNNGGQLAQSARGATALELALARGTDPPTAGRMAFSPSGLGCASCHGALAQGARGPALAGGRPLDEFRRVHGHGLFPQKIVSDNDFAAIVAYLKTVPHTNNLAVTTNEYTFSPATLTANAGKVRVTLKNTGKIQHEFVVLKTAQPPGTLKVSSGNSRVSEATSVGEISETDPGATKTATLNLKPGKYVFVCNIPGHYKLGMRGTLTIR